MANLFAAPPKYKIPLSLGRDLVLNFRNKVDDVYTPFDDGVTVKLFLDTIECDATISGDTATCKIESTALDSVLNGALWRVVVSFPTSPTTDDVPMNGTVVRSDGT
jgi:hypothetical protein